jgi:hypothetical protein
MILPAKEFLRRFLLHVLPDGFHRIRHYGLLAVGTRADIEHIGVLIGPTRAAAPRPADDDGAEQQPAQPELACPCCGSHMRIIETFVRGQMPQARPASFWADTS